MAEEDKKKRFTEEGRGRDGPIAARHHDADARLHEGHGEVNGLWPLLVDGQWTNCHHRLLIHHLVNRENNSSQCDSLPPQTEINSELL